MEKRKYDMSKYADMHAEVRIAGRDGEEIIVRNHIPYEEKEKMAAEMAENMIIIHDDSCIYQSSEFSKFKKYLVAKYYTDIDTEGLTPNDVADFMINNDIWHDVSRNAGWDYAIVEDIYRALFDSVKRTYEDDKSISKALRTSFGFLFNGEDIAESLAKAEAVKDMVYDAVGAWRKAEKEKEENIDDGTIKVGGNIINFAKRTE